VEWAIRTSVKAEQLVDLVDERDLTFDLSLDLLLGDEEMRVVLSERADPRQSVSDPRSLVTMQSREVGQADRKVAIGVPSCGIDLRVSRTVHRLHAVLALVNLGEEHVLPEVVVMTGDLEELCVPDQR